MTDHPGAGPTVTVLTDPDVVIETLTPFRRHLLALLDEPDSATGLARGLHASRQRVNYHLRALEQAGLVELVEERPRRGVTERVLRRRADVVLVDPTAFDTGGLGDRDRVGIAGVVSTARDLVGQAAAVANAASAAGQQVAMATLDTEVRVASPAAMRAMLDDVAAAVARHATDGAGLRLRVATMVVPALVDGPDHGDADRGDDPDHDDPDDGDDPAP